MECIVEYTDEFENWWYTLDEAEREDIDAVMDLLLERGIQLKYPYTSGINGSKHSHMRELRIQHAGDPYRVFYAFDPKRIAILLIGGNKTGDDDWYDEYIPIADKLYDVHLEILKKEDKDDG